MRGRGVVALAVSVTLYCVAANEGQAQVELDTAGTVVISPRDSLRAGSRAYSRARFDDAVRLLSIGLDPSAGPRDSVWVQGLYQLAESLGELDEPGLARTWLRWAFRYDPLLPADSSFPPSVVQTIEDVRLEVRTLDTARVRAAWRWEADSAAGRRGVIEVRDVGSAVRASLTGGGPLQPNEPRPVAAGTYEVEAVGDGVLPTRITVEVLPGVRTVLMFRLVPIDHGQISVYAEPWGDVSIDNHVIGPTPIANYRVGAGFTMVRITRPGYFPFDTVIAVEKDQHVRLGRIRLLPR